MSETTKTPTQQKKKLNRLSRLCFFGEFVSVFAPFITIGLVNYEKYFVEYDGTKISIGFVLAMAVMGIAVFLLSKKQFENSFITIIVGWAMVTGILFLIKELLEDLCYIMLFGLIGLGGAWGLDVGKNNLNKKAAELQEGIDQAKREMVSAAYKDEVTTKNNAKKVKIKVKN